MHVDMNYSHSGAILSLNTCDGYTKLKDGTKIDSVANRILLFDASEEHCSTTTTNVPARIAFRVSSNVDSRVIINQKGAESMLGKGDCLFSSPQRSNLIRMQSPEVSLEEIERVVNSINKK